MKSFERCIKRFSGRVVGVGLAAAWALGVPMPTPAAAAPPNPYLEAAKLAAEGKYEAAALEEYLKANRFDGSAWSALGFSMHSTKQYDKARPIFERAIKLGFFPATQMYNIACGYARTGHKDEAIARLRRALASRFPQQQTLEEDEDINSVRDDPRVAELTGLTNKLEKPLALPQEPEQAAVDGALPREETRLLQLQRGAG